MSKTRFNLYVHVCPCAACMPPACGCPRRPEEEPNPGPLEEWCALLTSEPPPQLIKNLEKNASWPWRKRFLKPQAENYQPAGCLIQGQFGCYRQRMSGNIWRQFGLLQLGPRCALVLSRDAVDAISFLQCPGHSLLHTPDRYSCKCQYYRSEMLYCINLSKCLFHKTNH